MNKIWKKRSHDEICKTVFGALEDNVNYVDQNILGVPATFLDDKVFNQDASFIKDAPFISTLIKNPNHIGCHTMGSSESFFKGTQAIERDLLNICAIDILKGKEEEHDGYVAAGGTEANLQAIWVYRNYFMKEHHADLSEICVVCSEDSHYSMDKASNVFVLDVVKINVNDADRTLDANDLKSKLSTAKENGKKYFIVVSNMMTTMFGSVDNVDLYANTLRELECHFKIHIDAAFGGFYYPFSQEESNLTFQNPDITSFTLDAHKMAQAPYGTGIFLIRKGFLQYANTDKASYVEGEDCTLIGSRSGANAVAVWMILVTNGPFGWKEKIFILQKRTEWMCNQLDEMGVGYYRHSDSNIITIRSEFITPEIAAEFRLVPDNHSKPNWYKIVVMEHVVIEKLLALVHQLNAV
jgi:glutamate/tyrosine decarboxylase-like PLP-dependent enzyme